MLTDLYIIDKECGEIHKVGTDPHDSLYVDNNGIVQYYNLQNGDGTSDGYEFVKYDPCVDELNPIEKIARDRS